MKNSQHYDLVVSLGGNCAAAHNLLYRGLCTEAFPFDWTYFTSDAAVYQLATGFKQGFKNYAQLKNFKELPINPSHPDRIQYEDTYGKIIWANHFSYTKNRVSDYKEVKEKLDRRFNRLLDCIKKSHKILFLFSTSFRIAPDAFLYLHNALHTMYPDKLFKINVLSFDAHNNYVFNDGNVEICYYKRSMNDADYSTTNPEWQFLDKINRFTRARYCIKRGIIRRIIKLIPNTQLRHKMKQKYYI